MDLIKVNWDSFCHDPDPNSAIEHFLKIVEKLLDKYAPFKNIKHPHSLNFTLNHELQLDWPIH